MSVNRENITWQSKDKTWNIGFYTCIPGDSYDDDYDSEWDADYDFNSFEWVSTGHSTEREAELAWRGANPGGGSVMNYSTKNAKDIAALDLMALYCKKPELAVAAAKKKAAKLTREHTKKLKEQFVENNDYLGRRVTVIIKQDDSPYTRMGVSQQHTGYAQIKDDWLLVGDIQVKNLKSGRLNRKLHSIESAPDTSGRGYRGSYWSGY